MDISSLVEFTHRGLLVALWVTLPTVLVVVVIGLLFAVIQATTQLQDQTAAQIIKFICASIVLAITADWMGVNILNFADEVFRAAGFHSSSSIL